MAKEQDQTQDNEETQHAEFVETKEQEAASTAAAVEKSKAFDKLIDEEGIAGEVPFEDDEPKETDTKDTDDAKADETDTGKGDDESEQQEDEEETASGTDATDTGESPISKDLAQKALDLGLTEEEVQELGSDEAVEKMVGIIESVMSEDEEKPAATEKPKAKATDEEESGLKFENEDDIDPELLKNIKAMEQRHQEEVSELRKTVDELKGGIEERERQEFVKRFDAMVEEQGLEFADVFGKGPTNDLGLRTKAFRNRDAVRGRMHALASAMTEDGQPMPPEKQLFDLAVNSLFKDKVETVKSARMVKKTAKHAKKARVGRAATKSAGSLTPHQKAVQTSKEFDAFIDASED
jgi:hypothetical protein